MNKLTEKEKSMYNLKPCPFCGGEAKMQMTSYIHIKSTGGEELVGRTVDIKCGNCGARSGDRNKYRVLTQIDDNGNVAYKEDGRKKAAEEWNRRWDG